MAGKAATRGKVRVLAADGPRLSVGEVVRRWSRERPLAVVCGGGPVWGETYIGAPVGSLRVDGTGSRWVSGGHEGIAPFRIGCGAMEDLRAAVVWGAEHRPRKAATGGTGISGWIASLSYELGQVIEPAVARKRARQGAWPLIELQRCEGVVAFDHARGEWSSAVDGLEAERALRPPTVGELRSETGQAGFEEAVARAIEYIRAGDVYQVNLAHRLSGRFSGSTREAFAILLESARPWHGAYMESGTGGTPIPPGTERRALISASPELFLRVEPGAGAGQRPTPPQVMTRPMKGTRPASQDASELRDSGKDLAELNMIVDLMRNDLGRVCRFGSVRVEEARAIERHGGQSGTAAQRQSGTAEGGVWQGVGTVIGELRDGVDLVDLLAAAFPAGSVTGAPKIRAMQIIEELEKAERGPYCGSIGWIGDDGRVCLNVAIRTACVQGKAGAGGAGGLDEIVDGELSFSVGAGIVAESEPRREWEETLAKAGVMGCLRDSRK